MALSLRADHFWQRGEQAVDVADHLESLLSSCHFLST